MHMFVNDLILNACVKTTEMFICEKILTDADIMVALLSDFECMRKNDRNVYLWKDFNRCWYNGGSSI